jgi:molecular chaperone GrpE (heat shock protein)
MDNDKPRVPVFPVPDLDINSLRLEPCPDFGLTPKPAAPEAAPAKQAPASDAIEEIAEDMVDIVQRLGKLERQMQESSASLASLHDVFAEHSSYQYKLVESVRRDLAGDRKALTLRALFDPAALALDQLEVIRKGFDPEKDQAVYGQVSAAAATLDNLLQSLGFTRFVPQPGDSFDPSRMQCLGYASGEIGVVLKVLRPGYLAGDSLVRPAGVLIADPEPKAATTPNPKKVEDTNAQSNRN